MFLGKTCKTDVFLISSSLIVGIKHTKNGYYNSEQECLLTSVKPKGMPAKYTHKVATNKYCNM